MKNNNDNFEKNISRLVKLTNDSGKPSEQFTESLINQAIDELKTKGSQTSSGRKGTVMTLKKILAAAAALIIVSAIALTTIQMTKQRSITLARNNTVEVSKEKKSAPIEYTYRQTVNKPVSEIAKKTDVTKQQIHTVPGTTGNLLSQKIKSMPVELDKKEADLFYRDDSSKFGVAAGMDSVAACRPIAPGLEPQGGYPMAHGGTTPPNGESVDAMFFKNYGVNPFIDTEDDHLSTFATDVDTASYAMARSYLQNGNLPPNEAVRVEEFVNYFKYTYKPPQNDDFAVYTEAAPFIFDNDRKNSYLLRIALKGREISEESRKPAILTFIIDVSGSMQREDRLGLVKKSLRMLIDNLRKDDRIGIAVYGSNGSKYMDYKGLDEKASIISAIESLSSGGSTFAEEGIRIGYEMAEAAYKDGCINRVILCSDGVANVGQTGADDILKIIKQKAAKGITLSSLGFGMGNYNDVLLERLGDSGDGYYAYIDTIEEARKLFGGNIAAALEVIARDVKVQVDFNPDVVRSYRLIGYENRDVPDNKFRDDKYDGGEVGPGHTVTALYELKLVPEKKGTAATTYVRYKDGQTKQVSEFKSSIETKDFNKSFTESSNDYRLAATVGEFAEILRKSYWAKNADICKLLENSMKLGQECKNNADVIELTSLISKAIPLINNSKIDANSINSTTVTTQEK